MNGNGFIGLFKWQLCSNDITGIIQKLRISKERLKVQTDVDPMKKQILCIILNITGLHITPPPPLPLPSV